MNHSRGQTKNPTGPLKNQRGQMAIFIALIFQVLFVFFAMSINVALIVHDKINLQNAVDLAAYYGAQRQAEMLNAIAHQNYQIRQSWKLLSWRYRILSVLGLVRPVHPARGLDNLTETMYSPAVQPITCVTYKPNWDIDGSDNLCNIPNLNIPPMPVIPVIAGFVGYNSALSSLSHRLKARFQNLCATHGANNWWYTMMIMTGYRHDQANRKQVIYALAANLAKHDFVDIHGNLISSGVEKTLRKNLTWGNDNQIDDSFEAFQFLNSLEKVPRENWLSEIQVSPMAYYTDVLNTSSGCNASPKTINLLPERPVARNRVHSPEWFGPQLVPYSQGSPPAHSPLHMSVGVEKNPWYNVYFGVKAQTKPKQIFFPIGSPVVFQARGFAKPFGGRIGPWHGINWAPGDSQSSGTKVDQLLPPREMGFQNSQQDLSRLPNYSRFPGDQRGLTTRLAQTALDVPGPHPNPNSLRRVRLNYMFYNHLANTMEMNSYNDPLAWDWVKQEAPFIRNYEVSAIAPDLFDITYYSIDLNYFQNYGQYIQANKNSIGIPSNVPVRPDLGAHPPQIESFSVATQMSQAFKTLIMPHSFYHVRDPFHTLTGWAPQRGQSKFGFPEEFYGRCGLPDTDLKEKVPGSCAGAGGRTGYSVKLISRDALLSEKYKIGGGQTALGKLRNPPPEGW